MQEILKLLNKEQLIKIIDHEQQYREDLLFILYNKYGFQPATIIEDIETLRKEKGVNIDE